MKKSTVIRDTHSLRPTDNDDPEGKERVGDGGNRPHNILASIKLNHDCHFCSKHLYIDEFPIIGSKPCHLDCYTKNLKAEMLDAVERIVNERINWLDHVITTQSMTDEEKLDWQVRNYEVVSIKEKLAKMREEIEKL